MTTEVAANNSFSTQTASGSNYSSDKAKSALSSDFETFIKMLTTQIQYQDPLEPMESTEFASQLAQFSMVEQQVQGNDLLSGLQAQMGLANMASMSGWVGMEARAVAPAYFDGATPITVSPNPAAAADSVEMIVTDSKGTEVARVALPVSAEPYQWDGRDQNGDLVAEGNYNFTIESKNNEELLLSEASEVYTRIKETQLIGGDVVLITESGSAILAANVTALRDAETAV